MNKRIENKIKSALTKTEYELYLIELEIIKQQAQYELMLKQQVELKGRDNE